MNQKTSFLILSIMVVSSTTEAADRYAQQRQKAQAAAAAAAAQVQADADAASAASGAVDVAAFDAAGSARAASRARARRASVGKFAADPAVAGHLRAASGGRQRAADAAVVAGHGHTAQEAARKVHDLVTAATQAANTGDKMRSFDAAKNLVAQAETAAAAAGSAASNAAVVSAKNDLGLIAENVARSALMQITAISAAMVAGRATMGEADAITERSKVQALGVFINDLNVAGFNNIQSVSDATAAVAPALNECDITVRAAVAARRP